MKVSLKQPQYSKAFTGNCGLNQLQANESASSSSRQVTLFLPLVAD